MRPYETVYTTAHEVHSTSVLNSVNIVYKSYGIDLEQKSVGPYVNPVNVQLIELKSCLIVLGRNRPYWAVLGTVQQSYEIVLQIVFKP